MQTAYYTTRHLEAFQASLFETLCISCYFLVAILDLASIDPQNNFNTKNGFVTLKLVGLKILL